MFYDFSFSNMMEKFGDEIAKIDPVFNDEESFYRDKNVSAHFNHLARDGSAFRRVYWDSFKKEVVSQHILPEDFFDHIKL
tara:strand:+ start:287 stop:526 length:240 start_codon:yes stop_codon:yes gene_type:complete